MIVKSKVKYINSLGDKKQRDEDNVFVAEGPKIINELLGESWIFPVEIFALKEWINENGNVGNSVIHEIDEIMLKRLSFLTTPNQVIGVFQKPRLDNLLLKGKVTLVADGIQDPGNLGTIMRCADWFGVEQVVCSKDSADVYNPKTVQATMGSIARVKVYYEDVYPLIQKKEVTVYAAALDGKDVRTFDRIKEGMIVIGNESKGIKKEILQSVDNIITIQKKGKAESLNVSVATGIILSHLVG